MKKISWVVLFCSISSFAGGFDCEKLHKTITSQVKNGTFNFVITDLSSGTPQETVISRLSLPAGSDVDAYQDRWGTFNELIVESQLRFPYMPETMLAIHIARSKKVYLEGFRSLDSESTDLVKLPAMYCKSLIRAMNEI